MSFDFSLLISVYAKESPIFLNEALESIWTQQSRKPSEIVLVKDGALTNELDQLIRKWQVALGSKLKVVSLNENKGLGLALNIGLSHCSHEYIARMDSDDISMPNRFELLTKEFEHNHDLALCGSYIREFKTLSPKYSSIRTVPIELNHVDFSCHLRNPFNHPSVMFRKSRILEVGGYKHMPYFEDYYLWVRVLNKRYKAKNIPLPLLNMRIDNGQLSRRAGIRYMKYEVAFYKQLYHEGLLTYPSLIVLISTRAPLRLLPQWILSILYKMIRSNGHCYA